QVDEMLAGCLSQEDEEAVLAELEAITQDEDVQLPEVPTEPLPAVPELEHGM
ncbi:charged multivesicular body protein 6, partial [Silurus meridionalis]